jgi:NAD(P)-dependent dehydrogenase (short-subunit alcohol dehydrogenase family)
MQGKVAIITGGGRGQGAEEAVLFAREGAAVAVCDVLEDEGRAVARTINDAAGRTLFCAGRERREPVATGWSARCSRGRAGSRRWSTTPVSSIAMGVIDTSLENWHRVMNVNLAGPFLGMKALWRRHGAKPAAGPLSTCRLDRRVSRAEIAPPTCRARRGSWD